MLEREHPIKEMDVLQLPPLILHPFSNSGEVEKLTAIVGEDESALRLLEVRYAEIRMLCFIGKDLDRWLAQCLEFLGKFTEAFAQTVSEADLIRLLLFHTPEPVQAKLAAWGIQNFESVFMPALGLSQIFYYPPDPRTLSPKFIEHFRDYADALYRIRIDFPKHENAGRMNLSFALYSSKEYIEMFEKDWEGASNLDKTSDM